jgi:NAD(P)-dependent dehydrogenase (short-subunit alcohol dehydrogenase family)
MDLGALLKGQRVLVTGASAGLGAHFARLFARCGAHLVVAARRLDKLESMTDDLIGMGAASVVSVVMDVADCASVEQAFATISSRDLHLDVVINNAGISGEALALKQSVQQFDEVIATNLRGVWLVATQAARGWKEQARGGVIVNIASIQGERVAPGLSAYSASKAGVVHLSRNFALEWARFGIRVNALEPGYISTELNRELWEQDYGKEMIRRIPMRRLGQPEDLDGALLLLASSASSWMTGSVLAVDGGHLVSSL